MSFSLLPRYRIRAVTQLNAEFLTGIGVELLMMDFDNTIVPYTTSTPTPEMDHWLKTMLASNVKLCVVSNSKKGRVPAFCRHYGIDCITHSRKPFPKGIRHCLRKYGLPAHSCALVGDQIFTDTLGANCCGVRSILVKAIDNHNIWLKLRHVLELPFIAMARKRRIYP